MGRAQVALAEEPKAAVAARMRPAPQLFGQEKSVGRLRRNHHEKLAVFKKPSKVLSHV